MEEEALALSSDSPPALNRRMTQVAADGDHPSLPSSSSAGIPAPVKEDLQQGCVLVTGEGYTESSGSDFQEIQMDGGCTGFGEIDAVACSLEIELIDDTAVIGIDDLDSGGRKKELGAKKPRRKSKSKASDLKVITGNSTGYCKRTDATVYSRKEMESLRYCNVKGQRELWQEVCNAFSTSIRTEYDELGSFRHHHKQSASIWDTNRAPGELGKENVEIPTHVKFTCDSNYNDEHEYVEDEDSDDSFSIQRPALLVEGEPDFESGPPEDGLEYLRRVRWEAAQIPNVKVAKLDKSKLTKVQSVYMPEIPEIERCPEHLLPLKQWEEEFLSDFSELRLAISDLDSSHDIEPVIVQSTSNTNKTVEGNGEACVESTRAAAPTLSAILKMDPIGRVSMLKRRIVMLESKDELSRNDCLWVFGLCSAIDTPLDADTSAVMRGLLRKCSKLRAGKSELDDEAVMLNILVTLSGKYFGQAENST